MVKGMKSLKVLMWEPSLLEALLESFMVRGGVVRGKKALLSHLVLGKPFT
jgi:hypothetical protein